MKQKKEGRKVNHNSPKNESNYLSNVKFIESKTAYHEKEYHTPKCKRLNNYILSQSANKHSYEEGIQDKDKEYENESNMFYDKMLQSLIDKTYQDNHYNNNNNNNDSPSIQCHSLKHLVTNSPKSNRNISEREKASTPKNIFKNIKKINLQSTNKKQQSEKNMKILNLVPIKVDIGCYSPKKNSNSKAKFSGKNSNSNSNGHAVNMNMNMNLKNSTTCTNEGDTFKMNKKEKVKKSFEKVDCNNNNNNYYYNENNIVIQSKSNKVKELSIDDKKNYNKQYIKIKQCNDDDNANVNANSKKTHFLLCCIPFNTNKKADIKMNVINNKLSLEKNVDTLIK